MYERVSPRPHLYNCQFGKEKGACSWWISHRFLFLGRNGSILLHVKTTVFPFLWTMSSSPSKAVFSIPAHFSTLPKPHQKLGPSERSRSSISESCGRGSGAVPRSKDSVCWRPGSRVYLWAHTDLCWQSWVSPPQHRPEEVAGQLGTQRGLPLESGFDHTSAIYCCVPLDK